MELTQKQSQKLSRTAAMLQSLELLQLPVCELASRLQDAALSNPLLDDCSMHGAKGVLINITGGSDITLFEIDGSRPHSPPR